MLSTSHAPGTAYLKFAHSGSGSVLTRSFATNPVKVIGTKGGRSACWVYAATLGGGILGGDEIDMTVDVGTDARAVLTTQASTKIYRSQRPARHTIRASVAAGALLAVVPDPLVCFAAADYTQTQRYDLDASASLVVIDWLTSGRHAAGERWAFSRYESRTVIARDNRAVFHDAVVLEPDLDSVGERMGRFNVLLTAVVTGPLVFSGAEEICRRIARDGIEKHSDVVASASKLGDGGTLLRIAGVSVEQVSRSIRDSFTFLCPLLEDDPWSRKW